MRSSACADALDEPPTSASEIADAPRPCADAPICMRAWARLHTRMRSSTCADVLDGMQRGGSDVDDARRCGAAGYNFSVITTRFRSGPA